MKDLDQERMADWILQGQAVVPTTKQDAWASYVKDQMAKHNSGIVYFALMLMQNLADGYSIEDTVELFNMQEQNLTSCTLVRKAVLEFSSRGAEFYEATATKALTNEERQILENKKQENAESRTGNSSLHM